LFGFPLTRVSVVLIVLSIAMVPIAFSATLHVHRRAVPVLVPTINELVPAKGKIDVTFTFAVKGTNFVKGSTVYRYIGFQKLADKLDTTYVSPTELSVKYVGSLDDFPYQSIFVKNTDGNLSNSKELVLVYSSPAVTGTKPGVFPADGMNQNIEIDGSGFCAESVVKANGMVQPVFAYDGKRMFGILLRNLFNKGGEISITVTNPAPGGGTSKPIKIEVLAP